MFRCTAFAVVIVAASAAALPSHVDQLSQLLTKAKVSPSVNISCVVKHCTVLSAECGLNKGCRDAISCAGDCFKNWDKDPSPQKFTIQNCTSKCAFTYSGDQVYRNFMSCLGDNNCMSFPPIPKTCKAPNITLIKQLSTKNLNGKWWVQRGYHKVYDCYPCQQLDFQPINETAWLYNPVYEVYLVNNSLYLVTDQKFVLPNTQPGENISFLYHDVGLDHYETWWLLDQADDNSWIQLYYCGNTAQWNYEGALVLSRGRTLAASAVTQIAASYKQGVGLDLNDFCYTDTSSDCMTP